MAASVSEVLFQKAHDAIRTAMDAVGLQEVEEIRLVPPTEPSMGDLGMACHPFARILRKSPKVIAEEIVAEIPSIEGFSGAEALNGYLNLRYDSSAIVASAVREVWEAGDSLGKLDAHKGQRVQIEFSGPNTNKPQHLGHVRNNVLGLAMSNLLEAVGYDVVRTNIINDRGIHICKSMLAYKLKGEGKTPENSGRKGDFLVGDFYVLFDVLFENEYADYCAKHPDNPMKKEVYFNEVSALGKQAKEMLRLWENEDEETRALWTKMNGWVYDGFNETYGRLGIKFDWVDYESDTYILGKNVVEDGMKAETFFKREDGAVVCDLERIGKEGQKVLLRSDGTSVYMTQDLGTAMRRFEKFSPERMIYVVADEQNYHFEVLFGILGLMEEGLGKKCHHLSYGMVDLPDGKMKSRKGTVVDADTLMDELHQMANERVREHFPHLPTEEVAERSEKIGQAGLKFFLLKFTPQSRIQFNPKESIEFQGETGPYCLYSYARGNSILAKVKDKREVVVESVPSDEILRELGTKKELAVGKALMEFSSVVLSAAEAHNPGRLAQYLFKLASVFSSFYQDPEHRVLDAPLPLLQARLALIQSVQRVIQRGLAILGIETIERM